MDPPPLNFVEYRLAEMLKETRIIDEVVNLD